MADQSLDQKTQVSTLQNPDIIYALRVADIATPDKFITYQNLLVQILSQVPGGGSIASWGNTVVVDETKAQDEANGIFPSINAAQTWLDANESPSAGNVWGVIVYSKTDNSNFSVKPGYKFFTPRRTILTGLITCSGAGFFSLPNLTADAGELQGFVVFPPGIININAGASPIFTQCDIVASVQHGGISDLVLAQDCNFFNSAVIANQGFQFSRCTISLQTFDCDNSVIFNLCDIVSMGTTFSSTSGRIFAYVCNFNNAYTTRENVLNTVRMVAYGCSFQALFFNQGGLHEIYGGSVGFVQFNSVSNASTSYFDVRPRSQAIDPAATITTLVSRHHDFNNFSLIEFDTFLAYGSAPSCKGIRFTNKTLTDPYRSINFDDSDSTIGDKFIIESRGVYEIYFRFQKNGVAGTIKAGIDLGTVQPIVNAPDDNPNILDWREASANKYQVAHYVGYFSEGQELHFIGDGLLQFNDVRGYIKKLL